MARPYFSSRRQHHRSYREEICTINVAKPGSKATEIVSRRTSKETPAGEPMTRVAYESDSDGASIQLG